MREGATGVGFRGGKSERTRTASLVVVSGVPSDWEWAGIREGGGLGDGGVSDTVS